MYLADCKYYIGPFSSLILAARTKNTENIVYIATHCLNEITSIMV